MKSNSSPYCKDETHAEYDENEYAVMEPGDMDAASTGPVVHDGLWIRASIYFRLAVPIVRDVLDD
jgi:hypothetical protein